MEITSTFCWLYVSEDRRYDKSSKIFFVSIAFFNMHTS
jgi:hypothetical protein